MANPIPRGTLLVDFRPDLIEEWDTDRNNELGLELCKVTQGMGRKVWWVCSKYPNHKWSAIICDRTRGDGCPYCANQKVLKGYNDMCTTNPELASQLLNPDDGYKYTQNANIKVDWKCNKCETIIKDKMIKNINKDGLSCKNCGDGMSYPEKLMYTLLDKMNVEFTYDSILSWSKRKQYDFYLPQYNTIIEMHGIQHYKESPRGRTLQEEQENDRYKELIAKENGVEHYIVIDCRKSDFDFITENIMNSKLKSILNLRKDNIKKLEIPEKTIVLQAWELWNTGNFRTSELAQFLKIGNTALVKYLKRGDSIGRCSYNPNKRYEKMSKKIIKLSLNNKPVQVFKSVRSAALECGYPTHSTIRVKCSEKGGTYDDFKWMYLEDYLKVNNILSENKIGVVC